MSIYRIVQYCKRGRSLFPSSLTAFASSSPRFLSSSAVRVGYLTDLEGDYQHWRKYCETSEIFDASPTGFALKEGCHFVFGGDLCDRNSGDLRLLTDFAALKRRYPDRVHFILGNRDINKLRLLFSLQQSILVDLHPPLVYWLQGLPAHIAQASKEVISGDPSTKLKWILSRTMGAPLAFQHRREELRELGMPAEDADVTRSFLESLTPRVGLLWEILSQGKISLIMGDTLFVHGAIHEYNMGWIPPMKADYSSTPNQISLNPPHLVPEKRLTSIRQWEQEINAFARNELLDYTNHAETYLTQGRAQGDNSISPSQFLWEVNGGYQHPQPGSRLIQYGMGGLPARQLNNTVIYSSYLQAGRAKYSSELASHWLSEQGIARVIVGHQPHGDAPWILNAHSVQTISADSAYSKNVLWPATHFEQAVPSSQGGEGELECVTYLDYLARTKDPRYPAAMTYAEKESTRSPFAHSEVLLTFHEGLDADKASSEVKISGTLSDTSSFSFSLKKGAGDSSFIGLKTKDDWFVKAENVVPSGGRRGEGGGAAAGRRFYLLAKSGDGFKFMNRIVEEQDLIRELYTP